MTTRRRVPAAIIAAILAIILVPLCFAGIAKALDGFNPSAACKIWVQVPEEGDYPDIDKASIPVKAYKIASLNSDEQFVAESAFSSIEGMPTTMMAKEDYKASNLSKLADEIMEVINGSQADYEEAVAQDPATTVRPIAPIGSAVVKGAPALIEDASGNSDFQTGLYIVVPQSVVEEGAYKYTFSPSVITLPSIETNPSGAEYFSYVVRVQMKVGVTDRTGTLNIKKSLLTYNTTFGPQTFKFHVVATGNANSKYAGKEVYNNYASLTFDAAGEQTLQLADGIPVNSTIVVEEVYSGTSYKLVSSPTQTTTLDLSNLAPEVSFTNDFDDETTNKGGSGIDNAFSHDKNDGWVLTPR